MRLNDTPTFLKHYLGVYYYKEEGNMHYLIYFWDKKKYWNWIFIRNYTIIYHVAIVTPRAELHEASLLIKREVFHVDLAEGLVNGRWLPYNLAVVMENGFRHDRHFVVTVSAVTNDERQEKDTYENRCTQVKVINKRTLKKIVSYRRMTVNVAYLINKN